MCTYIDKLLMSMELSDPELKLLGCKLNSLQSPSTPKTKEYALISN